MIDLPSVRPSRHVTTLHETIARALLPDNLMIETNWAQALMFLEKGEESRALYLAYKGKPDVPAVCEGLRRVRLLVTSARRQPRRRGNLVGAASAFAVCYWAEPSASVTMCWW